MLKISIKIVKVTKDNQLEILLLWQGKQTVPKERHTEF